MKEEKKEGRKDLFDITHYDLNKAVLSQPITVQTNTDQLQMKSLISKKLENIFKLISPMMT